MRGLTSPWAVLRGVLGATLLSVALCASVYGVMLSQRPSRAPMTLELAEGVTYRREVETDPRPLVWHVLEVQVSPRIRWFVTPPDPSSPRELRARSTSSFLHQFKLLAAVNGGFFEPFHVSSPLEYYPHAGDPVDALGLAISGGTEYSKGGGNSELFALVDGRPQILHGRPPAGTELALAGSPRLLAGGKVVLSEKERAQRTPHPRTAVALNEAGDRLWLVVVDGRQVDYSEGVTLLELAEQLRGLGASDGLNLDGGGSSTMVLKLGGQGQVFNAPYHTRIPMRERPVATHLGFALVSE